jgi:parallel beta-helix repeat protein
VLEDRTVPATLIVSPGGVVPGSFSSIQAAVNAAAPGDTVLVDPGTYTEQVTISKNLTLTGAGAATTIIQSPLILNPDPSGRLAIVEMASPANVVMSGFTVTGPVTAGVSSVLGIDFGILAVGAGILDLSATTVTKIHPTDGVHGNQTGHGIGVGDAATGRVGHANIHGVTVTDYNKSGIRVTGAGTTATITNNTVTGIGPTSLNGQNGITISAGGVATVSGNTVSLNEFNGVPGQPGGPDLFTDTNAIGIIDLGGGAGTTINGNTAHDNDIGIYSASLDPSQGPAITGNTVLNNRFHGVVLEAGIATARNNTISGSLNGLVVVSYSTLTLSRILSDSGLGVTPRGVTPNSVAAVTGNRIFNNTQRGVWVVDEVVDGVFPVATVFRNTIFNNGTGVVVGGGPNPPETENDHTVISQNSIFANTSGLGIDLGDDGVTLNQLGGTRPGPNNFLNFPVLTRAAIFGASLVVEGFARPGSVIELFIAARDPTGFGEGKTYLVTLIEGSAADLDHTTGSYGPGPVNGLLQGSDTTNRFRFVIPLASLRAPVARGTVLTSTATLSDPFTSEFSGNIAVTQVQPVLPTFLGKVLLLSSADMLGATLFVDTLYFDVLGRVPGRAALNHWVWLLLSGEPRAQVAAAILATI